MITFIGGPAAGKTLFLRRAPVLLRVVMTARGAVDALDQIDDEARPTEKIYVYRRIGQPRRYHIKMTRPAESGFVVDAEYGYLNDQPQDSQVRKNDAWQVWAQAQGAIG